MKSKPTVDRARVVKDEPLLLKDVFDLYEKGKSRRYGLLFSVNGGALAVISFLIKDRI